MKNTLARALLNIQPVHWRVEGLVCPLEADGQPFSVKLSLS